MGDAGRNLRTQGPRFSAISAEKRSGRALVVPMTFAAGRNARTQQAIGIMPGRDVHAGGTYA